MAHTSKPEFKRHRAMAGASASAMSATRFAPYRKIIREEPDGPYFDVEVLECGHRLRPREDMIGRTYTTSRRCVECLEAACAEDGHPLVDWTKSKDSPRGFGAPIMRCKCTKVNGAVTE